MDAYPKLRSDLQVSEQVTHSGRVYIIKEPSGGRIFRLPEIEYALAKGLDGRCGPDELLVEARQRLGDGIDAETLTRFIDQLRAQGLLESEAGMAAPAAVSRRLRGDPLYLRFKAFDPDAFLTKLLPYLRFCFRPAFLILAGLLFLMATMIAVGSWGLIQTEFAELYHLHAIVYAWLILLVSVSLHELAHGLTCKHFGGEVREMGFMLIYFQPAFYCNVSDAWLFPHKAHRLWVTFAGAFLDALLWAVAAIVWRITDPGTWSHFTALVVLTTAGIRTLFNINPLIKLDGYYLLSDVLEIPNLRARAFRFLKGLWWHFWRGSDQVVQETTARDRRLFITYGVLAMVYSVTLLGSILWWFGSYLVMSYGAVGFWLFSVIPTLLFRNPLRRSWLKLPERLRRGPAWFRAWPRQARISAAALGLLAVLALLPATLSVSGNVTILPVDNADMHAQVEGVISAVYVKEGDVVQKDAPIARVADDKLRLGLMTVEEEIEEIRAKLKQPVTAGGAAQPAMVMMAAASAAKTQEQLRQAERDRARMARLVAEGVYSRAKLEDVQSELSIRRKAVMEAQGALQMVRGEAQALQAQIATLESRRDYLRSRLERLVVYAPHAGVITTPKLEQKVGTYVKEGDLIASVHELDQVVVEIAVPEREIADVRIGQPVMFRARAYPTEKFTGRVAKIAPATIEPKESEPTALTKSVMVSTVIDNPTHRLKTGMTGYAKIEGERLPLISVIGHNIMNTLGIQVLSWFS